MYSTYGTVMKDIQCKTLDTELSTFIKDRDWDKFHSIKNLSMALSVEVSELVEIFQWKTEEESNNISLDEKLKQALSDEIADTFVYLFRIAQKANIDINDAVFEKIKRNAEKYPVEKSKGNAKKYTEL
jgi:dCTP diphosphatase